MALVPAFSPAWLQTALAATMVSENLSGLESVSGSGGEKPRYGLGASCLRQASIEP